MLGKRKGKGIGGVTGSESHLAQLVYSIGTSKVRNDSKERSDDDSKDTDGGSKNKQVAINGMDIVAGNDGQGAMLFLMASMEEESTQASKEERNMEEDSKAGTTSESADPSRKEDAREVLRLTARMKNSTTRLQLDSEEEASDGSPFTEDDLSVRSDNLDLQLSYYNSNAQEVSSGEFDARHPPTNKKCFDKNKILRRTR